MRNFRESFRWIIAAALAGCAMVAHAVPITGTITMFGGFTPVNSTWAATSLGAATGLDFDPFGVGGSTLIMGTGAFSTLGPSGSIKDFQFSPLGSRNGSGGILAGPVTNFWSAGAFSFALNSINVMSQSNLGIMLAGTGVVMGGTGTTATLGSWTLSGNTSAGAAGVFAWNSVGAASGVAVAEPGALALLGIGLVAIGAVRGRQLFRG